MAATRVRERELAAKLEDAQAALALATARLEQTRAALALAEAKNKEQREVMTDFLLLMGTRTTCAKCRTSVFWIRPLHGNGRAIMFDLNGCQHWPACAGAAPEQELLWKSR